MSRLDKIGTICLCILLLCSINLYAQSITSLNEKAIPAPIPKFGVTLTLDSHEYWSDFMPPGWRPPEIKMVIRVFNQTQNPVTFHFPTSQRYDFVIYNSSGIEVWRWSAGKAFLMVLGKITLNPGKTITFTYTHKFVTTTGQAMPKDTYTLEGILTSSDRPMKATASFDHYYVY